MYDERIKELAKLLWQVDQETEYILNQFTQVLKLSIEDAEELLSKEVASALKGEF